MTDEEYELDLLYYTWEEQEYMDNRLFYESDLEELEELHKKEKHGKTKERTR